MASIFLNCRKELRIAIPQLSDRCLYAASKWAAELLVGLGIEQDPEEMVMEEDEVGGDLYLLAKSLIDCREYKRSSHVLHDQTGSKPIFLRFYALYLAGEKKKEEEMKAAGPLGRSSIKNGELDTLSRELSILVEDASIDPFGLYLYGVVLREKGGEDINESLARNILVDSVNRYPCNWSAWTELKQLCTSIDILDTVSADLRNHWMKEFFLAGAYQRLGRQEMCLSKYEAILGTGAFDDSDYIKAEMAKAKHASGDLDGAEAMFKELLEKDPYRVDDMDVYSSILYAKNQLPELKNLAKRMSLTDRDRYESCCVMGTYRSAKEKHVEAIKYFGKAVELKKDCSFAWMLLGMEFIKLKNASAALDAFDNAVHIDSCNYTALHGLAAVHVRKDNPLLAIPYFERCVILQPRDGQMWNSLARCYEKTSQLANAARCYKAAAAAGNDYEARIAVASLAKLILLDGVQWPEGEE